MRRRHEAGFVGKAGNGGVRAFAGRAAGAVGYRHEAGPQGLEPTNGRPERLFHFCRLGREELKRHVDVAVAHEFAAAFLDALHQLTCSRLRWPLSSRLGVAVPGRLASQIETVSWPPGAALAGARSWRCRSSSPQSPSHWLTCAWEKPKRSWAN